MSNLDALAAVTAAVRAESPADVREAYDQIISAITTELGESEAMGAVVVADQVMHA
jgi:hypothetical protein